MIAEWCALTIFLQRLNNVFIIIIIIIIISVY